MQQITMNFPTPDTGISKYFSCLLSLSYTITLPGMRLLIFVLHNIYLNIFEGQHSFSPIFTEKYLFSKNDVSFFLCCWIVFDLCEFYSFYTLNFGKYVSHFFILSVLLKSGWNNMIKLTKNFSWNAKIKVSRIPSNKSILPFLGVAFKRAERNVYFSEGKFLPNWILCWFCSTTSWYSKMMEYISFRSSFLFPS